MQPEPPQGLALPEREREILREQRDGYTYVEVATNDPSVRLQWRRALEILEEVGRKRDAAEGQP